MGSGASQKCRKLRRSERRVPGNDAARDELGGLRAGASGACIIAKELPMRNTILAIAAIAGAMSAPIAAQAQSEITTGLVRGGPMIVSDEAGGIAADQRPAFR